MSKEKKFYNDVKNVKNENRNINFVENQIREIIYAVDSHKINEKQMNDRFRKCLRNALSNHLIEDDDFTHLKKFAKECHRQYYKSLLIIYYVRKYIQKHLDDLNKRTNQNLIFDNTPEKNELINDMYEKGKELNPDFDDAQLCVLVAETIIRLNEINAKQCA